MVSLSNHEVRGRCRVAGLVVGALALAAATPVLADTIANPVAEFSGLDKITGRITDFDVYVDETVQFGALQITPRACYTRPATETQRTSVFVEVDQVTLKGSVGRIFTGWMFADSPALNAIDNAVYDIWLIDCKQKSDVPPPQNTVPVPEKLPPGQAAAPALNDANPAPAVPPPPPTAPSEQPPADQPPADLPPAEEPQPAPQELLPPGTVAQDNRG